MTVWVEIQRQGFKETRACSGTQEEVDETIDRWGRAYGANNVRVVHTEGGTE